MRFAEDNNDAQYVIRAYAPGQITVNDELLTSSLVISPEQLLRDWPPQKLEDIRTEHLLAALTLQPEILLLGTGATLRFPHPSLLADVQKRGIGIEVMDTGAACRTYNILVAEGRYVVMGLLITPGAT